MADPATRDLSLSPKGGAMTAAPTPRPPVARLQKDPLEPLLQHLGPAGEEVAVDGDEPVSWRKADDGRGVPEPGQGSEEDGGRADMARVEDRTLSLGEGGLEVLEP